MSYTIFGVNLQQANGTWNAGIIEWWNDGFRRGYVRLLMNAVQSSEAARLPLQARPPAKQGGQGHGRAGVI